VIVALVEEAVASGARREMACELLGLSARGIARWSLEDDDEDKRKGPNTPPPQKLTEEERQRILDAANSPEFRDLSPAQIVPLLADRNTFLGSESTFYRVLRDHGQLAHRQHSRPARAHRPDEHIATGPNQVWAWDITYLRSPVRGTFFYLYMIVDVWSRKIVGWTVQPEESADHAKTFTEKAISDEAADPRKLVLHADNGASMKGSTMLATLQRLGVVASFSRPSVSDDNAYAEALFRTLKYRPGYPRKPFPTLADAAAWVTDFVSWYNDKHLHSGIRYVTPAARHAGRDKAILANRHRVYVDAKDSRPDRWQRGTRNWSHIATVRLNPIKELSRVLPLALAA